MFCFTNTLRIVNFSTIFELHLEVDIILFQSYQVELILLLFLS